MQVIALFSQDLKGGDKSSISQGCQDSGPSVQEVIS